MVRLRAAFAVFLAIIATVLVSCGGSVQTPEPPTYSADQIERIQYFESDLIEMRDRLEEIPRLVQTRQFGDIGSLLHGPLGELRAKMSGLIRNLLPNEQVKARQLSKEVFDQLISIDEAVAVGDSTGVLNSYDAAARSLDQFLQLIPAQAEAEA